MMDIFQILAEPRRRTILELLAAKGQLSATAISDTFSITPQAVSQHLKVLREAEFIKVEKRAQLRLYKINPVKVHELEEWIKKLTKVWDDRFSRLDKVLEQEKAAKGKGILTTSQKYLGDNSTMLKKKI